MKYVGATFVVALGLPGVPGQPQGLPLLARHLNLGKTCRKLQGVCLGRMGSGGNPANFILSKINHCSFGEAIQRPVTASVIKRKLEAPLSGVKEP